jgi:hypothetical protein
MISFGSVELWPIIVGRDIPVLVLGEEFEQRCRSTFLLHRRRRNFDQAKRLRQPAGPMRV